MNSFSFFHPAFLFGFAAAALPVIVHLLSRKRRRTLDFSTIRFFGSSALRTSNVRTLRRLLLLCTRVLMVAMLACIFAKPYNPGSEFSMMRTPGASVYCWIDPTKSMEYVEARDAAWRTALSLVDSIDKALPASSKRFLFDEPLEIFVSKSGPSLARDFSTRCGPSRLGTVLADFKKQSRSSQRMTVLVLVSDFQKNICAAVDSFFTFDTIDAPCIAVSVGPKNPWNIGIRGAIVPSQRPSAVNATVSAVGKDFPKAGISVVMHGMRVCREYVPIKKGGSVAASLPLPEETGPAAGELKLEADDPFAFDNVRYFVGGAARSFRVVIIGDSSQSFPIAAALHSADNQTWNPLIIRRPETVSYDDIDSSDAVILNEMKYMPRPLRMARGAVDISGKAIIVSPSIDSAGGAFAAELARVYDKKIKTVKVEEGKNRVPVLFDTVSPLWKGFPRQSDPGCAVYRYFRPLPGSVLLSLDNNAPLATHFIDPARNAWIFFATPMDATTANNIYLTGMYVPCLDRILRYALESIHGETDEWIAGKPRRNPFLRFKSAAQVFDAKNNRIAQWDGQQSVVIDDPGLYKIQPTGEAPFWIAVNADSEEISLIYSRPQCAATGKKRIRFMAPNDFLGGLKNQRGIEHAYGFWSILALLLFAEMLLWRRPQRDPYGGDKKERV